MRLPDIGDFADVPVIEVLVEPGAKVDEEDEVLVLESMKMQIPITAPRAGTVRSLLVSNGQPVEYDQPLVVID